MLSILRVSLISRLSFEEFMGEESRATRLFRLMDKDGDGYVTKSVWHQRQQERTVNCYNETVPKSRNFSINVDIWITRTWLRTEEVAVASGILFLRHCCSHSQSESLLVEPMRKCFVFLLHDICFLRVRIYHLFYRTVGLSAELRVYVTSC